MFILVWLAYPFLKMLLIILWPISEIMYVGFYAPCVIPYMEAMGRCLRQLQIKVNMTSDRRNGNCNEQ